MTDLKQVRSILTDVTKKLKSERNPEKVYKYSVWKGAMQQLLYELEHDEIPTKICRTCLDEKPLDDFYFVKTCYKKNGQVINKQYRRTQCIKCFNVENERHRKQREFRHLLIKTI